MENFQKKKKNRRKIHGIYSEKRKRKIVNWKRDIMENFQIDIMECVVKQ